MSDEEIVAGPWGSDGHGNGVHLPSYRLGQAEAWEKGFHEAIGWSMVAHMPWNAGPPDNPYLEEEDE